MTDNFHGMIMNIKRNNEQVKVTIIILNTVITVNKHINNCPGMRSVLMYSGGAHMRMVYFRYTAGSYHRLELALEVESEG